MNVEPAGARDVGEGCWPCSGLCHQGACPVRSVEKQLMKCDSVGPEGMRGREEETRRPFTLAQAYLLF